MLGISTVISQHSVTQRTILSNGCNKIYENASVLVVTKCGNAIQLVNLVVMVAAVEPAAAAVAVVVVVAAAYGGLTTESKYFIYKKIKI